MYVFSKMAMRLAFFILLIIGAVHLSGCNTSVPNLVGMTQVEAQIALSNARLTVGLITDEYSDSIAAGIVIRQNPEENARLPRGSAVALVISRGPAPVIVPGLTGLTETEAEIALADAGLSAGTTTTVYSNTVASGIIVSHSPTEGASVPYGSSVNLFVSIGPQPVTVPDLTGMTQGEAEALLSGKGLILGTVSQAPDPAIPVGAIRSQNPTAGASVPPATPINIVISSGPAMAIVPSVVGKTQSDAENTLVLARLRTGDIRRRYSSTVPADKVISQSPPANTQLAPDSPVDLVISLGDNGINITTALEMQNIGQDPDFPMDQNYILLNDIDANVGAAGFTPIGGCVTPFTGVFDGQGFTIHNLFINRPMMGSVGLFCSIDMGAVIKNVSLENIVIIGNNNVGGLVGYLYSGGTLSDCSVLSGSVTAAHGAGGLVGGSSGVITRCHAMASVEADDFAGGLVGHNLNEISDSYASGNVSCTNSYGGGLAAENSGGTIQRCYSTGEVNCGTEYTGGLTAANHSSGRIEECCATGKVSGKDVAGGLAGENSGGEIVSCFATGEVTGSYYVGGLVGWNHFSATIDKCYAAGAVEGDAYLGGLVGLHDVSPPFPAAVTDSFWDIQTTGQNTPLPGALGVTSFLMRTQSTFTDASWDFATIWAMQPGGSYPFLAAIPEIKP